MSSSLPSHAIDKQTPPFRFNMQCDASKQVTIITKDVIIDLRQVTFPQLYAQAFESKLQCRDLPYSSAVG